MGLLSLQDPPQEPAPRLTRAEAIFVSIGVHLLIFLVLFVLPGRIPAPLMALLAPRPAAPVPSAEAADDPAAGEEPEPEAPPIPLKFAYVRLPDDAPVERNPDALLLSDASRLARQEVPTPEDAEEFSIDPHSEGDSNERVKPDPETPAGREEPGASTAGESEVLLSEGPPAPDGAIGAGEGTGADEGEGRGDGGGGGERLADAGREGAAGRSGAGPGGREGDAGGPAGNGRPAAVDPQEKLRQALADIASQEFKFTFHNPAYLRQGTYGTMSFDTQDFPWGDFARILHAKVLSNWLDRIPLAARNGVRGYACLRFVIERDGSISEIQEVRPSRIPPFTRAAAGAIRATDDLPPLPAEFPHDSEGVTYCFFYNMYPAEAGF
jgi:TonB family protein